MYESELRSYEKVENRKESLSSFFFKCFGPSLLCPLHNTQLVKYNVAGKLESVCCSTNSYILYTIPILFAHLTIENDVRTYRLEIWDFQQPRIIICWFWRNVFLLVSSNHTEKNCKHRYRLRVFILFISLTQQKENE